mgnify:CR=1 FL=1
MALITIDEALAHCRLEPDYPAEQILPYIHAAESSVIAHLNRWVFEDQAALDAAQASISVKVGSAYDDYEASLKAATLMKNAGQREIMIQLAESKYLEARISAYRVINGIVINGSIYAAMLLTLGNLFQNRESDVVGVSVARRS